MLCNGHNGIWTTQDRRHNAKIPSKLKICLWLIWHNTIATIDNMSKRKWQGDTKCRFCEEQESIHHLFFGSSAAKYLWGVVSLTIGARSRPGFFAQYFWWISQLLPISRNLQMVGVAAICWVIWKLRIHACFEKKLIRSPAEIVCYSCAFMMYWAGLQSENDQTNLLAGSVVLQQEALRHHVAQSRVDKRLLELGQDENEEEEALCKKKQKEDEG